MDPPDLWNDSSETSLRKQKVLYLASRHHVRGSDWVSQLWLTHSLFLLEFAVNWVENLSWNNKMAVAEPKSSCVAAVRMDAWPMIGVIWPWRCFQMMKAHGKWQLFVLCIYNGIKIGTTFSLGQAFRSGISILALFISPLIEFGPQSTVSKLFLKSLFSFSRYRPSKSGTSTGPFSVSLVFRK